MKILDLDSENARLSITWRPILRGGCEGVGECSIRRILEATNDSSVLSDCNVIKCHWDRNF